MKEIKMIRLSEINPVGWNPPQRTSDKALDKLKKDVEKNGVLSPLHVIEDKGYLLVDGHRRYSISRQLEIDRLSCVVHDLPRSEAPRLWASLNKNTRTVNALEWTQWWYDTKGAAEKEMPLSVFADIRSCTRILNGREGIKFLLDHGVSPHIHMLQGRLNNRFEKCPSLKPISPSRMIFWFVKHGTKNFIKDLLDLSKVSNKDLAKIYLRISKDLPMSVADLTRFSSSSKDLNFES